MMYKLTTIGYPNGSIYYCNEAEYKGVMLTGHIEVCTDHDTKALIVLKIAMSVQGIHSHFLCDRLGAFLCLTHRIQ